MATLGSCGGRSWGGIGHGRAAARGPGFGGWADRLVERSEAVTQKVRELPVWEDTLSVFGLVF